MSQATFISAGFTAIRASLPVTVTYSGEDYVGVKSLLGDEKQLTAPGNAHKYEFTVRLLKSELDDNTHAPASREKVTIDGTTYRIIQLRLEPFGVITRLDLGAEFRD